MKIQDPVIHIMTSLGSWWSGEGRDTFSKINNKFLYFIPPPTKREAHIWYVNCIWEYCSDSLSDDFEGFQSEQHLQHIQAVGASCQASQTM